MAVDVTDDLRTGAEGDRPAASQLLYEVTQSKIADLRRSPTWSGGAWTRVVLTAEPHITPVQTTTPALASTASEIMSAPMARRWHDSAMARTRISTTVDRDLLDDARKVRGGTDAQLIDEALAAFLARFRAAEIDEAYDSAYRSHPIDDPDQWGDLASFRDAAAST